ncbi:hypothetical protein K5B73_03195 [Staphylococcus warneri]|nr:hypothetical protein [Staphylococcus warneri]
MNWRDIIMSIISGIISLVKTIIDLVKGNK